MKIFRRHLCVAMLILVPACGLLVEEGREVIAEVGGKPIRLNDLLRRIRELPFERRAEGWHRADGREAVCHRFVTIISQLSQDSSLEIG